MRAVNAFGIAAAFAISSLPACSRGPDAVGRKAVPHEITAVLDNSTQFVLLSVDPLPIDFPHPWLEPPKEVFHGHAILGATAITDKGQLAALLRALSNGI